MHVSANGDYPLTCRSIPISPDRPIEVRTLKRLVAFHLKFIFRTTTWMRIYKSLRMQTPSILPWYSLAEWVPCGQHSR